MCRSTYDKFSLFFFVFFVFCSSVFFKLSHLYIQNIILMHCLYYFYCMTLLGLKLCLKLIYYMEKNHLSKCKFVSFCELISALLIYFSKL